MKSTRRRAWLAAVAVCAVLSTGCAPAVRSEPARLDVGGGTGNVALIRVERPVTVWLATGYSRTLDPATAWRLAGRLPQGAVLRPIDTVFSIEGQQVHEAWLVVQGQQLVGFYLPAELRYAPLEPPLQLPIPPQ